MSDVLRKKDAQRLALLKAVYEFANGDPGVINYEDLGACAKEIGLSHDEKESAFDWLNDNGYFEGFTTGSFKLTREGVDAMEDSLREQKPAHEPPPPVMMHISGGNFGAIQTGSGNVAHVAQQTNHGPKLTEVFDLLAQIRHGANALEGDQRGEAIELVDALEEQAKSPAPKLARVKSYADTLKCILVAYAPMITELAHRFTTKS